MAERLPLTEDQITEKARDLTTKVENCKNVSKELNEIPFQERARITHEMEKFNAQDRDKDSKLPRLEVTYAKDAGDQEHVMDMQAVKDPSALIFKGKTDVYDLPEAAQSKLLFNDALKMAADSRDSEYLRDPDNQISPYHVADKK